MDTRWQSLAPHCDPAGGRELANIASKLVEARNAAEKDPGSAAAPLLSVIESLSRLENEVGNGGQKQEVLARLREKEQQARTALNLALNLSLQAVLASPQPSVHEAQPGDDSLPRISPLQKVTRQGKDPNGSAYCRQPPDFRLQ